MLPTTSSFLRRLGNPRNISLSVFIVGFAIVGTIMLFQSFALGTSTISGYAFQDANRNGIMDAGETPWVDHRIYLLNGEQTAVVAATGTNANGFYQFNNLADGDYDIEYEGSTWATISNNWVPTTTGGNLQPRIIVHLVSAANVNFGWRQIVRSTDYNNPISSYTDPNGLVVRSYDDVVSAKTLRDNLMSGSLIGKEISTTQVNFDISTATDAVTSYGGAPPAASGFSATLWIDYISWMYDDHILWHEYGHAWSNYNEYITQQDGSWTSYLKARGVYGDSRLYSNKNWDPGEMIAEDYRQLFGTPTAAAYPQANTDIPRAADVPGLRDFFATVYNQSPTSTAPAAPTNLTATAQQSTEGPAVQLSWTASTGASTYDVYRNNVKIGAVNSPSTTYYDSTNLSYGTSYSYYVKAISSSGIASSASNTATVTTPTPDTTPPTPPSGLSSPSQTQTSITLNWTASTDNVGVVGYKVYQVGGSRKNQFATLLASPPGTSFTVTGLKRGTSYSFYVTAIDAAGNESLPTSTLTVKTKR